MFRVCILFFTTIAYCLDIETTTASPNITTLYPTNKTITKNDSDSKPTKNTSTQTWRVEAAFAESNLTEVEAKSDSGSKEEDEKKERLKEFKPSPHLGSFFDEDNAEVIKTPITQPILKKPASGFVSSVNTDYNFSHKIPKEIYQTHKEFPYKFEDTIYTKGKLNWHDEAMDSRPTVEAPVRIPAGGFYKSPVAFKEKPHSEEEFGLDINEEAKEHGIKKRGNPWQHLLRLVTAFIPVGLIISALTPSVITIQNVDDHRDPSSSGIFRRSDPGPEKADLVPISERCRRRLLCELQSDRYYTSPSSNSRRKKHCYKIHCEDTEALWRMLRWLFTYNQPEHEQRGRHLT